MTKHTPGPFDKVRESAARLGESADSLLAHIDRMSAQHTPGPWKCSQHLGHPAWSVHMDAGDRGRGSTIVDGVGGIDREQRLANARLIAAAPDLLEALKAMRMKYGEYACEACDAADAAIAKATGEQL